MSNQSQSVFASLTSSWKAFRCRGGSDDQVIVELPIADIRFSHDSISPLFADNTPISKILRRILAGTLTIEDMPCIVVTRHLDEWVVLDGNRRLWVLKMLAKKGRAVSTCVAVAEPPQQKVRSGDTPDAASAAPSGGNCGSAPILTYPHEEELRRTLSGGRSIMVRGRPWLDFDEDDEDSDSDLDDDDDDDPAAEGLEDDDDDDDDSDGPATDSATPEKEKVARRDGDDEEVDMMGQEEERDRARDCTPPRCTSEEEARLLSTSNPPANAEDDLSEIWCPQRIIVVGGAQLALTGRLRVAASLCLSLNPLLGQGVSSGGEKKDAALPPA